MKLGLVQLVIFYISIGLAHTEETCTNDTYGANCTFICGKCRNAEQCNDINGDCKNGCMSGYSGDKCDYDRSVISLIIKAFIIAGCVSVSFYIIVMVFCTVFYIKTRKKMKQGMEIEVSSTFEATHHGQAADVELRKAASNKCSMFRTQLNSLMTFNQAPYGKKSTETTQATYKARAQSVNLNSWRESEFSILSDDNYVNMKHPTGPPRTSSGLIYANGILINANSCPPSGSYGGLLNEYVNLKRSASSNDYVSEDDEGCPHESLNIKATLPRR